MAEPTQTVAEPLANLERDLTALARGSSVGRYLILDPLGQGGMGVVYAGYDPELDRRVALKLLRPDRAGGEAARLRLLREAQAIARLAHPNVVAVYDAGTLGEQVFIAMELVAGETLRSWLAGRERSRREIVEIFVAAGRGLAAAHDAGLVHRDFKPDNVLIGTDGRPRVVDFGLARPAAEAEAPGEVEGSGGGLLSSPLTVWGVVLGTPAYMAPEQLRGRPIDARSDQFSFCVALWEALRSERPYGGETAADLLAEVESGTVREGGERLPGWLRQTLLRGLRAAPAERFESMSELLRALSRDPARVRRRWLRAAAALAGVGVLFAGLGYLQARRGQLCSGAERKVAAFWNAERKAVVRQAFLATGAAFAAPAWTAVERRIDAYTRDWSAAHREACEATRRRGEQSEDLLDRRMFCLDQRLREAEALAGLFARADRQVVAEAVDAAAGLAPLASCTDMAALRAKVPPPAAAPARARVAALGRELAQVKAQSAAGRYAAAVSAARPLVAKAAGLGYGPAAAEALFLAGDLEEKTGQLEPAEATLHRAVWKAEESADDEVKARAAIALVRVLGKGQNLFERADEWAQLASATVLRLDRHEELEAELAHELGVLRTAEGRYEEALAQHRRAVAMRRAVAPGSPALAASLGETGVDLFRLGRFDEAMAAFAEARTIQHAVLGADHPDLAGTLNRIGNIHFMQGRDAEAVPLLSRALALREAAFGANHPLVADSLSNLANAYDLLTRYDEALALYRRALAVRIEVLGPRHADVGAALDNIGVVHHNLLRWSEALDYHRRALPIRQETLGRDHPKTAQCLHNIAAALTELGRGPEALRHAAEALAINERALGPGHPFVAEQLTAVASLERQLGKPEHVLERLRRALRILEKEEAEASLLALTRFALAEALWELGPDRREATELARRARRELLSDPVLDGQDQRALARVEAWLAAHATPGAR